MTTQFEGKRFAVPESSDAARMLDEIAPVAQRSRRLTRDATLARPLLAWGVAWMTGAVLFQYVPAPAGALLGSLPCAGATAVSWLVRTPEVRLPGQRRPLLWFAFMAVSPLLVAVAAPPDARLTMVFLAALWAAGMILYGIGTHDMPLAVTGAVIVATAAVARLTAPGAAMLVVGITGGLGMALVGSWRMR